MPFLLGVSFPLAASANSAAEAKLRETLRNTMLQLRTAQNERAALQATQAEAEDKLKKATAELDSARKATASGEKTNADLQAQLTKFKEALQNWEAAYKQLTETASKTEEARAKLASEVIELQRQVADQRNRNAAMFRTANEILTRYERFSLGEALAAKEPFVGITRVKLENQVQDYEDKLADQRIKDTESEKAGTSSKARSSPPPKNTAATANPKP